MVAINTNYSNISQIKRVNLNAITYHQRYGKDNSAVLSARSTFRKNILSFVAEMTSFLIAPSSIGGEKIDSIWYIHMVFQMVY